MILKTINLLVLANVVNCKTGAMRPQKLAQEVDFDPNLDDSNMSPDGKLMLSNDPIAGALDPETGVQQVNYTNTMTSCLVELSKNIYNFESLR